MSEAMSKVNLEIPEYIAPQPYKRYCPKRHDTWKHGRTGDAHTCKLCNNEFQKQRQRELTRQRQGKPEYMPDLRQYREKCGYNRKQLSWESGLAEDYIRKVENLQQRATYPKRVLLFQAFAILKRREEEAKEEEEEKARRLVRAGLV